MMLKLAYITFMLVITTSSLFGQTSFASATATIVTPVGAEISGDINFKYFSGEVSNAAVTPNIDRRNSSGGVKIIANENRSTSLNIIGGSFAYDITIQTEPVVLKTRSGSEIIHANLFKGISMPKIGGNKDIINLPVNASFTNQLSNVPEGSYASTFIITVNFN